MVNKELRMQTIDIIHELFVCNHMYMSVYLADFYQKHTSLKITVIIAERISNKYNIYYGTVNELVM